MNNNCINFFELSINELLTLNLILTLLLANQLNSNQLNILGNFICSLGQSLLTLQAVVGTLPDDALYTICTNPSYTEPTALSCTAPNLESISAELQSLKEQLHGLEMMLASQKR